MKVTFQLVYVRAQDKQSVVILCRCEFVVDSQCWQNTEYFEMTPSAAHTVRTPRHWKESDQVCGPWCVVKSCCHINTLTAHIYSALHSQRINQYMQANHPSILPSLSLSRARPLYVFAYTIYRPRLRKTKAGQGKDCHCFSFAMPTASVRKCGNQ